MRMNEEDFPAHNESATTFAYGEPAELLSFARTIIRGLEDSCWETKSRILQAPAGCDKFDWWDAYVRVLGGYGLVGSISVAAGRMASGNELLVDIPFCGVVQDGDAGVLLHVSIVGLYGICLIRSSQART